MDEFSFINSIKQPYYRQSTLQKGIGDDAAVFRQTSNDIVTAVDTFVEGIHFAKKTMPAFYIGYRALAATLSDLAAMGANPAFYLVSIVIPKGWHEDDKLQEIFRGMDCLASKYGLDLIGGDTVSGLELTISITVIGYVQKNKARYRSLSKPGDIVFVTGTLGDSQAGLYILMNEGNYVNEEYFIQRHQTPIPRIDFVKSFANIKRIALNDISDGVASEAREIANESQVNIILNIEKIPMSKDFNQFPLHLQNKWKLFGGEDFEILGTVPVKNWPEIKMAGKQTNVQVTKIGYVDDEKKEGQVFLQESNQIYPLHKQGYTHLK